MRYLKYLFFGFIFTLLLSGNAKAAEFNGGFKDWSETTKAPLSSGSSTRDICTKMFEFQSDNVLSGTFCDLANIAAVSVADFATNVTCTIQAVGMTNYDKNISFESAANSTGASIGSSLCTPKKNEWSTLG